MSRPPQTVLAIDKWDFLAPLEDSDFQEDIDEYARLDALLDTFTDVEWELLASDVASYLIDGDQWYFAREWALKQAEYRRQPESGL